MNACLKTKTDINQFVSSVLTEDIEIEKKMNDFISEFNFWKNQNAIQSIYLQFYSSSKKLIWFTQSRRFQKPLFQNTEWISNLDLNIDDQFLAPYFQDIFVLHKKQFLYFERTRVFLNTQSEINLLTKNKLKHFAYF